MTTGRKDVVFVDFGSTVVAWNVVRGKVLMLDVPGAKDDFEKKGIEVDEVKIKVDGEDVTALAMGVRALGSLLGSGRVIEPGDPRWEELFGRQGLIDRRGYGEVARGRWRLGGYDSKKE